MNPALSNLLSRVCSYHHHCLANSTQAREQLAKLGVKDASLLDRFSMGFVDGTLPNIMPKKGDVKEQLATLGILDANGEERFKGSFVIPVSDDQSRIAQVAFYSSDGKTVQWLFNETPTWWNAICLKHTRDILMVRDPLSGLIALQQGSAGVIAPAGPGISLGQGARDVLLLHKPKVSIESSDSDWVEALSSELAKLGLDPGSSKKTGERLTQQDPNGFTVEFPHDLRFVVQGLVQDSARHLRASVKLLHGKGDKVRLHLDTLDLYHAKSRLNFARTAAVLLSQDPTLIEELTTRLVSIADEFLREQEKTVPQAVLTDSEKSEALGLLKDPKLLDRVLVDLDRLGYVGEETNKLIAYVASISRKLEDPLSVLVVSRSGAGKSTLAETVMQLTPPEDLLRLTRLTPQTLYYQKANALRHKLIVVEEESGVQEAGYALRILQSAGRLSLSTAAGYGEATTREVRGPASIFLTTTKTNLDEETAGRFLTLTTDESVEQTKRILKSQRLAETRPALDREKTLKLHQNAQRLIQSLPVVNPFAPKLSFPHHRLSARRDHKKYLALIRAVTLLHQHQRQVVDGSVVVDLRDIEIANRLADQALGQSLYDLTPPSRRLLVEIRDWLKSRRGKEEEKPFSQRELREKVQWKKSQLAEHVRELVQAEYLIVQHESGHGRRIRYVLDWDGRGLEGERFFQGLTDIRALEQPDTSGSLPGHVRVTSGKQKPRNGDDQTEPIQESGSKNQVNREEER